MAKMEEVKAHIAVINELYSKLVAWVKARVATTLKAGSKKLIPPDVEEHRLLAQIDQQKAKTREFINDVLGDVMDAERRQHLIDLRTAVEKMALNIRFDGRKKAPNPDDDFGDGLSEVAEPSGS